MKPFLILQLRPETDAADAEFHDILTKGGIDPGRASRIRLDQQDLPAGLDLDDFAGVIVGGGPGCVSDPADQKTPTEARIEAAIMGLMPEITARDLPFMGCCYGMGILGKHLGAEVGKGRYSEPVRATECQLTGQNDPLTRDLPPRFLAFVGHKEALHALPEGCVHLIGSDPCPYQMIRYGQNVYATQFHPEADGEGFAERLRIYQHKGYFAPHETDALMAMCRAAEVIWPQKILRGFVERYG